MESAISAKMADLEYFIRFYARGQTHFTFSDLFTKAYAIRVLEFLFIRQCIYFSTLFVLIKGTKRKVVKGDFK